MYTKYSVCGFVSENFYETICVIYGFCSAICSQWEFSDIVFYSLNSKQNDKECKKMDIVLYIEKNDWIFIQPC